MIDSMLNAAAQMFYRASLIENKMSALASLFYLM